MEKAASRRPRVERRERDLRAGQGGRRLVTTRWGSTAADNQWWQVDLGSVRKVIGGAQLGGRVRLALHDPDLDRRHHLQRRRRRHDHQRRREDHHLRRSRRPLRPRPRRDPAHPVRHLVLGGAVYGPPDTDPPPPPPPPPPSADLALNKPATSSSTENATLTRRKAVDGSSTTRWSSSFADTQWWQVDLGSAQQVAKVELNWEAAYASRYKILTSTDGTNFTEAADVSITSPGLKTTTFTARSARYVRVLGVTRATQYGISFWDARVYGPEPTRRRRRLRLRALTWR